VADLFGKPEVATQPPDALPQGEHRARGAYYTPDLLALACCRAVKEFGVEPGFIFEPGCGGGAFLRAARETWPGVALVGVDLVPACTGPGIVVKHDLFTYKAPLGGYHLIIGNPDFGIAEQVVRHCLGLLGPRGSLAMLLRISFLSSLARVPLYRDHPIWSFIPIAGRPSFTGGGSDTSEYGLFVWRDGHVGPGVIMPPMEWKR
jgi:hypothetical protein